MRIYHGEIIPDHDRKLPPIRPDEMREAKAEAAKPVPYGIARRGARRPVVKLNTAGQIIARYPSVSKAADAANVHQVTMSVRIQKGTVVDGFTWKFE